MSWETFQSFNTSICLQIFWLAQYQLMARLTNFWEIPLLEIVVCVVSKSTLHARMVEGLQQILNLSSQVMHEGLKHQRHHGHFVQPDKAPSLAALLESGPAFF